MKRPFVYRRGPEQNPWRMCHLKKAYEAEADARLGHRRVVYRCPLCGKWHRSDRLFNLPVEVPR